jgi:hypothetical protein
MPTALSHRPEELDLDGQYTASDIVWALEHIPWEQRHTVTIRIDRDVVGFLIRTLRRHAARAVR